MNDKQKQTEIEAILKELEAMLKEKGKTEAEIMQIFVRLASDVEMAVVEEIVESMPAEKQKEIAAMTDQKKSSEEIAKVMQLDPNATKEIELEIFEEYVKELLKELEAEK